MSELTVVEVVSSEVEAEMLCGLLRTAGIESMHRLTDRGAGAFEGLPVGGPREILVREEDLGAAREVLQGADTPLGERG